MPRSRPFPSPWGSFPEPEVSAGPLHRRGRTRPWWKPCPNIFQSYATLRAGFETKPDRKKKHLEKSIKIVYYDNYFNCIFATHWVASTTPPPPQFRVWLLLMLRWIYFNKYFKVCKYKRVLIENQMSQAFEKVFIIIWLWEHIINVHLN